MKSADLQGTTAQAFHWNEYHGICGIPPVCPTQAEIPFQRSWRLPGNIIIESISFQLMDNLNPTSWIMCRGSWASSQYQERG